MIALRRVRAHLALFAALFGVCAVLAGLGTALAGYLDAQARTAVVAGLTGDDGAAVYQRFDAPKSATPQRQRDRAWAIIRRELAEVGGADVPVRVDVGETADGNDWLWTVTPVLPRVDQGDLPAFAAAGDRIADALRADRDAAPQGVEKTGALDTRARALQRAVAPLAAVEPLPLLFVAATGIVTLAELGRLLVGVRTRETSLVRSRGARAIDLATVAALETGVVAVAGAILGIAVAWGVLAVLRLPPAAAVTAAVVGAIVVIVAVLLVSGATLLSARRAFRRDSVDDSGRVRRLADPIALSLLVVAAALALWRFVQFGSPLSPTAAGTMVDPIAAVAPALCVTALAVVGLAVFPIVARLADRAAERGVGIGGALVSRQLSRRVRMFASPFVLIAVAVGGLVLAACYQSTWRDADFRTASLHAGADLVVSADATHLAAVRDTAGVRGAAPVAIVSQDLDGGGVMDAVGVPADELSAAGTTAGGTLDPAALSTALRTTPPAVPLPKGTTSLSADVSWTGVEPQLTLQLVDGEGRVASASFTVQGTDAPTPAVARIPPTTAPGGWMIAAIDAYLTGSPDGQSTVAATLSRLSAAAAGSTTTVDLGTGWTPGAAVGGDLAPNGAAGYVGTVSGGVQVRLTPPTTGPVPIVLSRPLADRLSAHVGTSLTLMTGIVPAPIPVRVAAVVPVVPGSSGRLALLIDLAAAQVQSVRVSGTTAQVDHVWVGASDPAATLSRLERAVPGARVTGPAVDSSTTVLAAVPPALWVGMAGSGLLALAALAAVAGELARLRIDEVAVLRALGMPGRRIARLRQAELALVCAGGAVAGAIAGWLTAALTVTGLARAAILDPYAGEPIPLHIDVLGVVAALSALAVVAALVLVGYGADVRRGGRRAVTAEAPR